MSLTKEIIQQENGRTIADRMEIHLHKEDTFLRAYDWSAWQLKLISRISLLLINSKLQNRFNP
jgi:hypothetical protein